MTVGAARPDEVASSRTVPNGGSGVVYFFQAPEREDLIYLGHTDDFQSRRRAHESTGRKLLALMPASRDFEQRLHRHFRERAGEYRPSQYAGEAIVGYIEALIRNGLAVTNFEDVAHVPRVPWSAIEPGGVDLHLDANGQLAMFRVPVRDRIKCAASVAYHSSESDEWYTPEHVIEAARKALGSIDLDPASCPRANATVRAAHYFSRQVNGLAHGWHGNVWLNPPYGESAQEFVGHLFAELDAGHVTAAIVLLNQNSMSSQWFAPIYSRAACLLITGGRLRFEPGDPGQAFSSPSTGSVLCYFGRHPDVFRAAFAGIGHALLPGNLDSEEAA